MDRCTCVVVLAAVLCARASSSSASAFRNIAEQNNLNIYGEELVKCDRSAVQDLRCAAIALPTLSVQLRRHE